MILKVMDYRERLHQCINIQGHHLSDVLFKTRWCKTAFCVLSRNRKTFAVSSLVLNLFASQIGEFFLPHPVYISKVYLHLYAAATEDDLRKSKYICCVQRKSNKMLYLVFVNCELLYWNPNMYSCEMLCSKLFFFLQFLHNYYCIITLFWYN